MSRKERQFLTALSVSIFLCMLICVYFGWPRSAHSNRWHFAFYALLGLSSSVSLWRTRNMPAIDTLIRLFPKPTQQAPEKP